MRLVLILSICCVVIIAIFLASGETTSDTTNDATSEPTIELSVDAIEFKKRTRLELNPIRVWWHEEKMGTDNDRVPGPSDYLLRACLELNDTELQQLISQQQDKPKRLLTKPANWWPAPLQALGEEIGVERYDAHQYSRQPYFDGRLSYLVDTNFIIVEFSSR